MFVGVSVCLCFTPPQGKETLLWDGSTWKPPLPAPSTLGPFPPPGLDFNPIPGAGSGRISQLLSLPRAHVCFALPHCVVVVVVGGVGGVTLQVSRRVQIFLVSGFITPHCLLRSHSFPVGKAVPVSEPQGCFQ